MNLSLMLRSFSCKINSFRPPAMVQSTLRLLSSTSRVGSGSPSAIDLNKPGGSRCADKKDFNSVSDDEWSRRLTPEQFCVCRGKGTEPPFTGKYYTHSEPGTYTCGCCGTHLFSSESKFDSGSGWPSFSAVLNGSVVEQLDLSMGVNRTEVLCSQCSAHLGHVFTDGPHPTGMRYCINSICLNFIPKPED